MKRGDVFEAALDPTEGSEQGGRRPVLVVSRDAINQFSPIVIVLPISKFQDFPRVYPSQLVVKAGVGGLALDSVVMAEQVRTISKTRLVKYVGHFPNDVILSVNELMKVALDLP